MVPGALQGKEWHPFPDLSGQEAAGAKLACQLQVQERVA